jgi:DNA polymerase II small subunit/DNA polymerase delta subunit B
VFSIRPVVGNWKVIFVYIFEGGKEINSLTVSRQMSQQKMYAYLNQCAVHTAPDANF